jgi:hypothetical protein
MLAAVHPDSAERRRTVKRALPCDQTTTHSKEHWHGKRAERTAKNHSWQRHLQTHGKEATHGKEGKEPTAKKRGMAKAPSIAVCTVYAVRPGVVHGKGAFAVRLFLCRAQYRFLIFFSFLFYSF